MRNNKLIIGITGGSGAGKTTVSDIFREYGIPVIDADIVAREITERGTPALAEIAAEYDGVLTEDGALDRKKLGAIVFSDKERLNTLNKITHKYITRRIHELIDGCGSDMCAVDGAALFESELSEECDVMCAVTADEAVRRERIIRRDGISAEAAQRRIASQKTDEEYARLCGCTIRNDSDVSEVRRAVGDIITKLKEY